jgi:hypothetical protein
VASRSIGGRQVLAAMEEKCKILEATQEDMGVMDGALKVYGFCFLFFVLLCH